MSDVPIKENVNIKVRTSFRKMCQIQITSAL